MLLMKASQARAPVLRYDNDDDGDKLRL